MFIKTETIELENKEKIVCVTMNNGNNIEVEILSLGAIIKRISTPNRQGKMENILLEFKDINDYMENPGFLNAIVGRTAGRIAEGKFTLDHKLYSIEKSEGNNTLHGGLQGFHTKIWDVRTRQSETEVAVTLYCKSEDKEEGYPGNLFVKVEYILDQSNALTCHYEAIGDQDTLVNLTNHSYFNLSGDAKDSILEHELQVKASRICELDEESIPTGKLLDLEEKKAFDFKKVKAIGQDIEKAKGYDHPWLLDSGQKAIRIYDKESGRHLTITTNQDAVVIYTMNKPNNKVKTREIDNKHYGICFETQHLPIGRKECFKEKSILKAGDTYLQETKWQFETL